MSKPSFTVKVSEEVVKESDPRNVKRLRVEILLGRF